MKISTLRNVRIVRLCAIMFLVAIFMLCSGVIALYFFATPEKIRLALMPVIEEHLKCDVEFSGIEINLFSGVRLTNLDLAEQNAEQPWLQVDEAVLRYRLFPLLRGHLVIDEIRLNAPSVVVRRNADGAIAIGSMVRKPEDVLGSLLPPGAESMGSNLVDFHISTIRVADAEVLVRDFIFGSIPRLTRFQEAGLQLENFSTEEMANFALWGKLNGTPFDLEGTFSTHKRSADLEIILEDLNLVAFQPYYRNVFPFKVNRLAASAQCRLRIDPKGVGIEGDVRFTGVDIADIRTFASEDDTFTAQELKTNIHLQWEQSIARIKLLRLDALMDGLQIGVQGTAHTGAGHSEYTMEVNLNQWPVRALAAHTSIPWLDHLEEFAPAGMCSATFDWRKDAKDTHASVRTGRISLVDVGLSVGKLRFGITGDIQLEGNKLNAPSLSIKIGGEDIRTSIFSKNWRAQRPQFKLNFNGTKLDTRNLFPSTRIGDNPGSSALGAEGNVTRLTSEPGPYALPFDLEGAFDLEAIIWRTTELGHVQGNFSLKENNLLLRKMDAVFASGKLSVSASVDLDQQGFSYNANIEGSHLNMKQASATLWPGFSGSINGKGRLSARISGAGTQHLRMRQNLSGTARIALENSTISGGNALHALAEQLGMPSLNRMEFSAASAEFILETGNAPKFNLLGRNEGLRISSTGNIDWQGEISGALALHMLPEKAKGVRSEFASSIRKDENGWSVVECGFLGNIKHPEFYPLQDTHP